MYFDDTDNGLGSRKKRTENAIKRKDMYAATIQANM